MTPVEIFEYKQKWMASENNHPFSFHSDYRRYAKDWCKKQLHQCQFKHSEYTDVYEDTLYFEHYQDQEEFELFLKKITSS